MATWTRDGKTVTADPDSAEGRRFDRLRSWTRVEADRPSGNASRDDWADYATQAGVEVPDDAGRDDIRDLFTD